MPAACEAYGYKVSRALGQGAFGAVYEARKNGETVAVKHITKRFTSWNECMQQRELSSLHKMQKEKGPHANIVSLREVIHSKADGSVFIVMEFVGGGNLYDAMSKRGAAGTLQFPFSDPTRVAAMMRDLLLGCAHMHRRGFMHRDIKPENLLLDEHGGVKIADFGCAREIRSAPPYTDYVSTRWYRAPENALRSREYSSPVDVWACGVVLAEVLGKGEPLFPATSELDLVHRHFKLRGDPWTVGWGDGCRLATELRIPRRSVLPSGSRGPPRLIFNDLKLPESAAALCEDLLKLMPSERPTAISALDHEFFAFAPPRPPDSHNTSRRTVVTQSPSTSALQPQQSLTSRSNSPSRPAIVQPIVQDSPAQQPRVSSIDPSSKFSYDFNSVVALPAPSITSSSRPTSQNSKPPSLGETPRLPDATCGSSSSLEPAQPSLFASSAKQQEEEEEEDILSGLEWAAKTPPAEQQQRPSADVSNSTRSLLELSGDDLAQIVTKEEEEVVVDRRRRRDQQEEGVRMPVHIEPSARFKYGDDGPLFSPPLQPSPPKPTLVKDEEEVTTRTSQGSAASSVLLPPRPAREAPAIPHASNALLDGYALANRAKAPLPSPVVGSPGSPQPSRPTEILAVDKQISPKKDSSVRRKFLSFGGKAALLRMTALTGRLRPARPSVSAPSSQDPPPPEQAPVEEPPPVVAQSARKSAQRGRFVW